MRIFVRALPKSREEKVEKIDEKTFIVRIKEAPVQSRANSAIIKALADYFGRPKLNIRLVAGRTSKNKVFEIVL